ncbi:hypothetical protein A3A79_01740 [Candidatus Gottesmanbacteria bacterium RIFCSPLOWO2_01_FULL_43_11b]|uniref:Peptidase C39-like domain-containing protein n=1 Tax=Candidatus Gottesmanbacteria bacterium RIFCSPLOWO2_01_FULL_43_11b TaxID=1798392 RepID=A0A1F6AHG5_9BACT|nr:MAG: hypothetical protein A3A79_01740 [Candidatus Gottesmanbacteria bacterium RIFCSPLOWO2_01_FULL_43_11b]
MLSVEMRRTSQAHFLQSNDWFCTVAIMRSVHHMRRDPVPEELQLAQTLGANIAHGVAQKDLVSYLAVRGIPHRVHHDTSISTLWEGLRRGNGFLVSYQEVSDGDIEGNGGRIWSERYLRPYDPYLDDGHDNLLFGLTENSRNVYLLDPGLNYQISGLPKGIRTIPLPVFECRWIDSDTNQLLRRSAIEIELSPPKSRSWVWEILLKYFPHIRSTVSMPRK